MKKLIYLFLFILALILSSCGDHKNIIEPKDYKTYSDPALSFSMNYPSNWLSSNTVGTRFLTYSSKEGLGRFRKFDLDGEGAAKAEINAIKLAEGQTIDSIMAKKQFQSNIYSNVSDVTIDGVKGFKQTYQFELGDGFFQGEIYYAQKDPGYVTIVTFEAFANTFEKYNPGFQEMLKSVKLAEMREAKSDTVKKVVEAPPPSATLSNYKGDGFVISVPDNFDVKNPKAGVNVLKSYVFTGERRADSEIRIDIIDASKQNKLDKIVQDNKKNYPSEPRATTVGGDKGFVFEYNARADVKARVYFAVKGNKLYRMTVTWFTGEEASYKPIFEKSVSSLRFQ